MERHVKQKGYLLIVAVVLIVILAVVGVLLTRLFEKQADTSSQDLESKKALYLAISGLEIAKRDVTKNNVECNAINTQHNNEPLLNGQFSVTGTHTIASSSLASSVGSASSSILLNDASGFASRGIVKIGNEQIYYHAKSGNQLNELTRGKAGTVIASHSTGSVVSQNQCLLTSTGAIPTMSAATATKRTVSSVVLIVSDASFSVGGYTPTAGIGGNLVLTGNAKVINPSVTLNGSNYPGSTIAAVGNVTISGNGATQVGNGSGGLVESSDRHEIQPDIQTNVSSTNTMFENYFGSLSQNDVKALAQNGGQYYTSFNASSINGVTGKVIWIDDNASLSSNTKITLGTLSQPVVLVVNGNFSLGGNAEIELNGIIFVTGDLNMSGNGEITGNGAVATGGSATVDLTGNAHIDLSVAPNDTLLTNVYNNIIPGGGTITYITQNIGIQEVFN